MKSRSLAHVFTMLDCSYMELLLRGASDCEAHSLVFDSILRGKRAHFGYEWVSSLSLYVRELKKFKSRESTVRSSTVFFWVTFLLILGYSKGPSSRWSKRFPLILLSKPCSITLLFCSVESSRTWINYAGIFSKFDESPFLQFSLGTKIYEHKCPLFDYVDKWRYVFSFDKKKIGWKCGDVIFSPEVLNMRIWRLVF